MCRHSLVLVVLGVIAVSAARAPPFFHEPGSHAKHSARKGADHPYVPPLSSPDIPGLSPPPSWDDVVRAKGENMSFAYVNDVDVRRVAGRDASIEVVEPILIPWGSVQDTAQGGSTYIAHRYVLEALDKNKVHMLLYPYEFSMEVDNRTFSNSTSWATPTTTYNQTFKDGAFVDTGSIDDMPTPDDYYFHYLTTHSNIDMKRAKGLYDSSIAVLQVTGTWIDGIAIDLTYESDSFCTIFYSYIWGKYAKCFRGIDEWDDYMNSNAATHEQVSIIFLSPQNISNGALKTSDGSNRFGMLILPDIVEGAEDQIFGLLDAAKIRQYVSDGGFIYSSGKSALLVERLGMAATGTFSGRYTLTSPTNVLALATGCTGADFNEADADDFTHRSVCFSVPHGSNYIINNLLSGAKVEVMDPSYKVFATWKTDASWRQIAEHDTQTGLNTITNATSLPMIMYRHYGVGQVLLNLGNSPYDWNSFPWVYNAFLVANVKPLVLENEITGATKGVIPALETVTLQAKLFLKNYYSDDVTSAIPVKVWGRTGVTVTFIGSGCTLITSGVPTPPLSVLDPSYVFDCSLSALSGLSTVTWQFSLDIVDNMITQDRKEITLLYPLLSYAESTGKQETIAYPVAVDAAMAALLRADMNIDPSSMYPLHARGSYVDNVLNCENKEETEATEVSHVSIVPLITPLIDISDQVQLASYMEFDVQYYKLATNQIMNYLFPFVAGTPPEDDYLDFTLMCRRHDSLAASWDEAVKIFRVARDTFPATGPAGCDPSSVMNANYQTNNDNDFFLLRQHNFYDADAYYEHATQRMMAFLDPWTPEAAATFYSGAIPAADQAITNPLKAKRRVLFVRHDIFFWTKYPLPDGITSSDNLISMDRYPTDPCTGNGPQSSTYTFPGVFSSADPRGLVPQEWQNELLMDCNRRNNWVQPADLETYTGGQAKLIHYLIPVIDPEIRVAEDMLGFAADGTFTTYPEVKFITAYQAKLDVDPALSRKGGEMIFTFATDMWSGVDPVANGWVTIAADQIAIIGQSYSNMKLHIKFKRGNMPNEAYGNPSHLQINLEGTNAAATISATMDLFALVYDIADAANGYERYDVQTVFAQAVSFVEIRALSMPAARLSFIQPFVNAVLKPYEFLEPFVRYGVYEQELLQHRAVHGSAEIHPIAEPCLVTVNGGFSAVTHIGTSSVPFREYVNTGISLLIPASPETGRIEWKDIWGRHWVQPVRSTIFEYPPIPPPLRNFVMTTTFELLDASGNQLLDWRSEDTVDVRVQMKLLNNYPKWFEITTCKANEVMMLCTEGDCEKSRLFDTDFDPMHFVIPTDTSDDHQFIKIAHNASYGKCFKDAEVYLSGEHLTSAQRDIIQSAEHCAQNESGADCEKLHGLPTVSRRPSGDTTEPWWNFAQQVEDYWPNNYVKGIMWDLTHYDYDDNKYDKAYKYHMDNNLPHLGHYIKKVDNFIAFPIFKGCGYRMVYDRAHSHPNFPGKQGWWSDNLQNNDRTLVAGQPDSNDISVGGGSLLNDADWIDIEALTNADTQAAAALTDIYTCLFNRKRYVTRVDNGVTQYLTNVYENNVIPIPPSATDADVNSYSCTQPQYSPETISQFDNMVYTDSPRDWLYFASNLRGNALEDINVLYQLMPLDTDVIKYEGIAKVQDGGRFTYWNPANSRNSWLIVDNPVSTVFAIRNDLKVELEVIPTYTTTFDALVFQHITVKDEAEEKREWTDPIYIKHHGFGDFVISVYVGGNGGDCIIQPGGRVRVKFTFSNNAGFDINLKSFAITSSEIDQQAINSNDLMFNLKHTLKYPDKYNFMNVLIPPELQPYLQIEPCKDVVGIAPLFFDFDNINVATIRDGWKGDYYYWLSVLPTFPDAMRGRLYTLPMALNTSCFDRLPGANSGDPTPAGYHKYTLSMPPIVFGVPYASSHRSYPGKVFWTSGYSSRISVAHVIPDYMIPDAAAFVTVDDLDLMRKCLGGSGEISCMTSVWAMIKANRTACAFVKSEPLNGVVTINYQNGLSSFAPTLPIKVAPTEGPDPAEVHILLRTTAPQLQNGFTVVSYAESVTYSDWADKAKSDTNDLDMDVHAKGAWLSVSYSALLVSESGLPIENPALTPADSGFSQVTVRVRNSGDAMAYNVNMSVLFAEGVVVNEALLPSGIPYVYDVDGGDNRLTLFMNTPLAPGVSQSYVVYVTFGPDTRSGAGDGAPGVLGGHPICWNASGSIDLTATRGERTVTQNIPQNFVMPYGDGLHYYTVLEGHKSSSGTADLVAHHSIPDIKSYIWRCRAPDTTWNTFQITTNAWLTVTISDVWSTISGTSYSEPVVNFMVSVSREAGLSLTSTPTVMAESNVWVWDEQPGNLLWLLLLIPALLVPAAGLAFLCLRKPGTTAIAAEPLIEKPKKPARKRLPEPEPVYVPPVAPVVVAAPPSLPPRGAAVTVVEVPEPKVVTQSRVPQQPNARKATRYVPDDAEMDEFDEQPAQHTDSDGPTYLMSGACPVNVVDSRALPN